MPVDPVRDAAIDTLLRIVQKNETIAAAIDKTLRRKGDRLSPRGRRFMTQLVYGTTRHDLLADHVLTPLLHQPLEKLPLPIRLVLRMGVFQALFANNVTFPAMVHTSVDLAKRHGTAGAARLVNAVLKRVPESIDDVALPDREMGFSRYLSVRYSTPEWLVRRWIAEHGESVAETLCTVACSEAPRYLRVNTRKTTRDALVAHLARKDILARPHDTIPDAVEIVNGAVPTGGKSFQRGEFYVQDAASMLAAHLLAPQPGERIIDLCASPGGKTTHVAQLLPEDGRVHACDIAYRKLRRVRENAVRLDLPNITLTQADAIRPAFADASFDAVLLDAPCSGLGTLRRHPDLKTRTGGQTIQRLARQQIALLRSALTLCKNNGRVVYAVCTFTPEETLGVLQAIQGDGNVAFEDGPEWMNQWRTTSGQYRVMPTENGPDGYFLTRLRKRS